MGGGDVCLLTDGGGPARSGRKEPFFDQVDSALGAARNLPDRSIGKAVERVAVQADIRVVKPW